MLFLNQVESSENILFTLLAKSLWLGLVTITLVSSAYSTMLALCDKTFGRSLMYSKKARDRELSLEEAHVLQVSNSKCTPYSFYLLSQLSGIFLRGMMQLDIYCCALFNKILILKGEFCG